MGRARPFSRPDVARIFRAYPPSLRGRFRELAVCIETALTYHRKTSRRRVRTRSA